MRSRIWLLAVLLLVLPRAVAAQDATTRYRLACNRDDGSACSILGLMYELGASVPRDAARAVTLYERA